MSSRLVYQIGRWSVSVWGSGDRVYVSVDAPGEWVSDKPCFRIGSPSIWRRLKILLMGYAQEMCAAEAVRRAIECAQAKHRKDVAARRSFKDAVDFGEDLLRVEEAHREVERMLGGTS